MSIQKKLTIFGIVLGVLSLALIVLILLGARQVVKELVQSQLTGQSGASSMGNRAPFILIAALIVLIVIMIQSIMKSILRPLKQLSHVTKQMSDGQLDVAVAYHKNDEFKQIFEDFDSMRIKLKESIQERERLEQMRFEMIQNISHDLRTPLTSIQAYAEGLSSGLAKSKDQQDHYVAIIKSKTNDIEHLIEELTVFSKLDAHQVTYKIMPVNFTNYLEEIVSEYSHLHQTMKFNLDLQSIVRTKVLIDPLIFKRVIQNVFDNSWKYRNKEEVTITVVADVTHLTVNLSIIDDGPGVDDSICDKLFDKFYRSDKARQRTYEGSGLGLAIAQFIVLQHGGKIWATSQLGEGLAIHIALPVEGMIEDEDINC